MHSKESLWLVEILLYFVYLFVYEVDVTFFRVYGIVLKFSLTNQPLEIEQKLKHLMNKTSKFQGFQKKFDCVKQHDPSNRKKLKREKKQTDMMKLSNRFYSSTNIEIATLFYYVLGEVDLISACRRLNL